MGQKIQPGQFPSASEWNRHVDASDYVHSRFLGGSAHARLPLPTDVSFVTVKNNSGATRRQGDILEFTGCELTDLSARQVMLTGGSPTLANGFGVLRAPAAAGEFGDCQVAGVAIAYVNVSDADDRYAVPAASNYVLQSAAIGPVKILYKPSGTGEKTCAVHLLGVTGEILVKNDTGSAIAAGSSGTFKVFSGTPGSESDTGQTIVAFNKSSVDFKNGKFGAASYLNGHAYAAPWQT